jgi:hypothetical protein
METLVGTWRLSAWAAVRAYQFDGPPDEFLYQDPAEAFPREDNKGRIKRDRG